MNQQLDNEEAAREKRRQMIKEMQRQKQKQMKFRKFMRSAAPFITVIVLLLILAVTGGKSIIKKLGTERTVRKQEKNDTSVIGNVASYSIPDSDDSAAGESNKKAEFPKEAENVLYQSELRKYSANMTADTVDAGEEIISKYAVLIALDSGNILVSRKSSDIIDPASMTKILTVLVAAEHVGKEDLDKPFTMTLDITDYSYRNHCSNAGFEDGETITVRDLFYGTVLPSGADGAVGLATYVAGSHEAFVEMMNEKLEEMGLSETTHFANCVGLYAEEHYSTVYDMAMILEAALDNELCREVLSTHTYVTSKTPQHPEGIEISNWFLRRIEDKDTGGEVVCAKTGFVNQSGNCAASYGVDHAGNGYVCVTVGATSAWRCIYDHVALYKQFAVE